MNYTHRRHDISDRVWELLEPHLPGREGTRGVTARDNRCFLNAVFWIIRTGAPCQCFTPAGIMTTSPVLRARASFPHS